MSLLQTIFGRAKGIVQSGVEGIRDQLSSEYEYTKGQGVTKDSTKTVLGLRVPAPKAVTTARKVFVGENAAERLNRIQNERGQSLLPSVADQAVRDDFGREAMIATSGMQPNGTYDPSKVTATGIPLGPAATVRKTLTGATRQLLKSPERLAQLAKGAPSYDAFIKRTGASAGDLDDVVKAQGFNNSMEYFLLRKEGRASVNQSVPKLPIQVPPRANTKLEERAALAQTFESFSRNSGVTPEALDATAKQKGYRDAIDFYHQNRNPNKPVNRVTPDVNTPSPRSPIQAVAEKPSELPKAVNATPVARGEANSLEATARQLHEALPEPYKKRIEPLEEIVTPKTPVSKKVNLLDYLRTPDRVMEKIGLKKDADMLRNQYEQYVMELPKNIDKITEWSQRVPPESNQRIFLHLDGQSVVLNDAERQVANEVRAYLDEWADRLKIPPFKRVSHYITHIFDNELANQEFDEDLAKIITEKLPNQVYDPFLEKRLGAKGYKLDTWAALDAYTKRATRKVHLDPVLSRLEEKVGNSLDMANIEASQWKYVKRYIDRVNMRPTELDNLIDNSVKQVLGYRFGQRPVTAIARTLRKATYRGMLGGNLGSALRNLSQGVNTYATLGERDTLAGYTKLFSGAARKELSEQGILENNFIQDRTISATMKLIDKADKALWYAFDKAERINRGAAYFGAKNKALRQGKNEEEAIRYAKEIVRKTQFSYDAVDTPVALSGDLVKTLMQFQSYTTKQVEYLAELAKNKNFAALARYALSGYVFVNTLGKAFGMEEKELLPMFRFDVPPSLKLPAEIGRAAFDAPDQYGNDRSLEEKGEDITKAGIGLIPGGAQIRKTLQGMEANQEGGSFDSAGRRQFETGQTPASQVQNVLFGKWSSQAAKDYFKKDTNTGNKALDEAIKAQNESRRENKVEETKILKELSQLPPEEANARLKAIYDEDPAKYKKIVEAKQKADQQVGFTDIEKGMTELGIENGARAQFILTQLNELSTREEKNAYLENLYNKKIVTDAVMEQLRELLTQ